MIINNLKNIGKQFMPEILKADRNNSLESVICRAAEILTAGGVIAYPTETFYGLGANAACEKAIERIYAIKGRKFHNPISVIIDKEDKLQELVQEVPENAQKLIKIFWPGPLTIIFNASGRIPSILTAGTGKIGVRISSHIDAGLIAQKLGRPLTATSANQSGAPECSSAEEVLRQIGNKIDAIVDSGITAGGKGSTIIDVTAHPPQILREGVIERLAISKYSDLK
jgi:L-threonylcarbamoyladenylate synthase